MSAKGISFHRGSALRRAVPWPRRLGAWALAVACIAWACAAPATQGAQRQATRGRIDIYVLEQAFDLGAVRGSPGTALGRCTWLGAGAEKTGVTCEKDLGREWERIWVEFVPEADGAVDIDLQGEWYEQTGGDDVRLVLADDVAGEGTTIGNPGFEEGDAGGPAGWRFTGPFPPDRYRRDDTSAHEGRACVAVWHGCQARQQFAVKAGNRYRVSAWFRALDPQQVHERIVFRSDVQEMDYAQKLQVEFRTPEAAQKARLRIAPLYGNKQWAVSCRWDDNSRADLKMRDVMAAHGYRGTFYLNAPTSWFGGDVGRQLLADGNTIGGHSMTHPFLSFESRNRQFWEVLACRMLWEAVTDNPVCSCSFAFCDFRNEFEGDAVQADITESLRRAGYYHIANGWFNNTLKTDMELSPILPSDGAPIDAAAEGFLNDAAHRDAHPHMSFSMHVWYTTPEAWRAFEQQLDDYGRRPNWWYCNQNEYAAYRWQYNHTKGAEDAQVDGDRLTVELRRPILRDLGDRVPLTLLIEGVEADAVAGAGCPTADVELVLPEDGPARLDLHHDRAQQLPAAIDVLMNEDNHAAIAEGDASQDFRGLKGLLHFDGERLRLTIETGDADPLRDVAVTYRLPGAWKDGVVRHRLGDVPALLQDEVRPTAGASDYKHTAGRAFYGAQVDFTRGGRAGRLHLGCTVPAPPRDSSYPQGGFLVLGPVSEESFRPAEVEAAVRSGTIGRQAPRFAAELGLDWQPESREAQDMLDVEVVATTGRWDSPDGAPPRCYLLRSMVQCPGERQAALYCDRRRVKAAYVNGESANLDGFRLAGGRNELVLIVQVGSDRFHPSNAGCFLRVTAPGSTERMADLRFTRNGE